MPKKKWINFLHGDEEVDDDKKNFSNSVINYLYLFILLI